MKLKFNGILVLLIVLMAQLTFAQERAVTGVVSDNTGMPIPGVSVLVKGTNSEHKLILTEIRNQSSPKSNFNF
jgi:hypothetical protein